MYFDFDKSMFVKRAFDILDEDASGSIVRANYCRGACLWRRDV